MTSRSPTLVELLTHAIEARVSDIHVALPGRIESYDSSKQTCSVKPLLKRPLVAEDGSNPDAVSLPVLSNVPVAFPRGGGFFMSLPLQQGDNVMLVFCERSLDVWKSTGGEVDPIDVRPHPFEGAVAYPGLYDQTAPLSGASGNDLVIGKDSGAVIAIKSSGEIDIGQTPAAFVALANKVNTELNKIAATLATGSNSGGPVVFGTPYAPSDVSATKTKAE